MSAYRLIGVRTERGKAVVVFSRPASGGYESMSLPCGQCIGCRLDRSRQWAVRCVHEASLHELNCFVTLTYDDAHVPADGSLVKCHHQLFLKRLRAAFPVFKIRYFLCGEYGDENMRPHFHLLIFGMDFPDKVEWCESKGNRIWRSPRLEELWPYGYSWIGEVTWQSAAYVARYVLKKVNGDQAWERYCRDVDVETGECRYLEPEYIAMSRRPGIAAAWYQRFKSDCRKDFVTHEGKKYKLPRYYDRVLEIEDIEEYERRKQKRKEVAKANRVDGKRLLEMEHHQKCVAKQLKRSL